MSGAAEAGWARRVRERKSRPTTVDRVTSRPFPPSTLTAMAVAAAIAAIALTFMAWIDLQDLGIPVAWNAYGQLAGGADEEVFATPSFITPFGWFVAGGAVATVVLRVARRWLPVLGWVAVASAVVPLASIVVILVRPSLFVGDLLWYIGAADLSDRVIINTPVLIAEILATGLLLGVTATAASAARRTPPDPEHTPSPEPRPAPPADE